MDKIGGTNKKSSASRWLRPVLVCLPLAAILATLLFLQPWSGSDGPDNVLAKATLAAEGIESYRMEIYATHTNNNQEPAAWYRYTFEYVLPDYIHLNMSQAYNTGDNGVLSRNEGSAEFYFYDGRQYSGPDNDENLSLYASDLPYYYNGNFADKEYALELLEFLDDLEQLPDEVIDGVACLHYSGTPKLGIIPYEVWLGKGDYIIRQIYQTYDIGGSTAEFTIRYYDFNADIAVEPPVDASGEPLPGWEVTDILPDPSKITVEEALAAITGEEDWSDPETVNAAFEMLSKVDNFMVYFNGLPEEAQQALKDSLLNPTPGVTVTTTSFSSNFGFNDGVLHYSNSEGVDAIIDASYVNIEGYEGRPDVAAVAKYWAQAILADDPQAYFDALTDNIKRTMVYSLASDEYYESTSFRLQRAVRNR
jgi:outer membrane lipoprotein-sorting protein